MSEMEWIVQREEQRYPATDVETLRQWAVSGNIRPADQVWSPLRGEWTVAAETPEISGLLVHPSAVMAARPAAVAEVRPSAGVARASTGARAAAYLIDVLPAIAMALIAIIPLIGHVIAGLLLGFYWLYRDAAGFSLGKMAVGLKVVRTDGAPATRQALMRRNLPIAVGSFVLAIPILGLFLGPVTSGIAFLVTVVLLATDGYTLGDKWAGTTVVKRS
jgi:uncharacterized RDD family membrane protein YckC